ncbi:hypothetical protein BKK50_10550 [Rodentibacter rarus]|uniref:Uncharacterized protein n=1 Tax=Rodentibacter rarus TaxID=1908260 RepID=A0A1V3IFL8_9PAST|nr:hypothetical protein [Rodentibacter rarus]OOF39524.1 hypothetical protein BKK50_10550 [Rodentibacter rarus]
MAEINALIIQCIEENFNKEKDCIPMGEPYSGVDLQYILSYLAHYQKFPDEQELRERLNFLVKNNRIKYTLIDPVNEIFIAYTSINANYP